MKIKFYILVIMVLVSTLYGAYSAYKMVIQNRTPFALECIGKKLKPNQVIAFSNDGKTNQDTIYLGFEQSRAIMPSTLGWLYFDQKLKHYVVKNNACIFNPSTETPANPFLPFCHTLNDGTFQNGKFFGNNQLIIQSIVSERGIKYNSAVGDRENRISVKLLKHNGIDYIQYKDEGLKVKYLVQSKKQNTYDIFLNKEVSSNNQFVFSFAKTTTDTGQYSISISANALTHKCILKDVMSGKIINSSSGSSTKFDVGGFLFEVTPKYTIGFVIVYCLFFIVLLCFQGYFLVKSTKSVSPPIFSLFSIRILLNCIVFLATPVFVTAYYLGDGRIWYLALVILLNVSYFTSKAILHNFNLPLLNSKLSAYSIFALIILLTVFIWRFTWNEALFGKIPILHIQKIIILSLILALEHSFLNKAKFGNLYKFTILVLYSLGLSLLTKDIGSFIYATLAFLLIELIRKTLKLKYFLLGIVAVIATMFTLYNTNPTYLCGVKSYRIIAPYTTPDNHNLVAAKEADKETYSTLILNLKNIFSLNEPHFNEVVVPGSMRTTLHSDFAFHWSLSFGGLLFLMTFLPIFLLLVNEFLLLLFLSTREVKISNNNYFALPKKKESVLIRFYLSFTIIQFIYPVLNNVLLIPLTGQSIPCLSISNCEIIFLIVLLLCISSVFTNEKYITGKGTAKYRFGDAKASINFVITFFTIALSAGFIYKAICLKLTDSTLQWKKHINNEYIVLKNKFPKATDKDGLAAAAKSIEANNNNTLLSINKKDLLKELASLYYSGQSYSKILCESDSFKNSTAKLLNQMTVDSLFNRKSKLISGSFHPFGNVYSFCQKVNNKAYNSVSNRYYRSIPLNAQTINADLTALCCKELELHLKAIGISSNIGAIMIVENQSGKVIANGTYPISYESNSNQVHYLIGSLKKLLIAYAALKLLPNTKNQSFNGKIFSEFIKTSDDIYAANLLKSLLLFEKEKFTSLLLNDFGLPLHIVTDDSYLDSMPEEKDFTKPLDKNNSIYRLSIGQQAPYTLETVLKWYSRIASGLKVDFKFTNDKTSFEKISMNDDDLKYLKKCFNSVLYGTAEKVRKPLDSNGINIENLWCKTGTAERTDKTGNTSSSFIICNDKYSISVMLKGNIPHNKENYSAKDLFISLIPILKKYKVIE